VTVVLVALAGALGAVVRALVLLRWPRGAVFAVNIAGSFLLGLVAESEGRVGVVVGVGFCGALTTFSGFAAEAQRQHWDRHYVALTLVGCVLAVAIGLEIAP